MHQKKKTLKILKVDKAEVAKYWKSSLARILNKNYFIKNIFLKSKLIIFLHSNNLIRILQKEVLDKN